MEFGRSAVGVDEAVGHFEGVVKCELHIGVGTSKLLKMRSSWEVWMKFFSFELSLPYSTSSLAIIFEIDRFSFWSFRMVRYSETLIRVLLSFILTIDYCFRWF